VLEIEREKAVKILEDIAEYMGNVDMFSCVGGNTRWYDLEDIVYEIIKTEDKEFEPIEDK